MFSSIELVLEFKKDRQQPLLLLSERAVYSVRVSSVIKTSIRRLDDAVLYIYRS